MFMFSFKKCAEAVCIGKIKNKLLRLQINVFVNVVQESKSISLESVK